jgi:S-adenosylmethionine:tRNA ribosyltransferase-isomerase
MGILTPLDDFDYVLPREFIAQNPAEERDSSRLMVLSGSGIRDMRFKDITGFFSPGDCLVINSTRVIPAKIFCKKATGGKVELLMLGKATPDGRTWSALCRDNIHGKEVVFADGARAAVTGKTEAGEFLLEFDGGADVERLLDELGEMPLPPYINRKNAPPSVKSRDRERYQTVYASRAGSVAAPTAGLHFTRGLLAGMEAAGVEVVEIVTHIGWDTFRPVRSKYVENHRLRGERFEICPTAAKRINSRRESGGRVFAVGTSVIRALESSSAGGRICPSSGKTDLFIFPGYSFKAVDAVITNFHLPKSTPYLLACAFAGKERIKQSYEEAKRLGYRFYSYGDAMLILPGTVPCYVFE